jgi:hypothetical protein
MSFKTAFNVHTTFWVIGQVQTDVSSSAILTAPAEVLIMKRNDPLLTELEPQRFRPQHTKTANYLAGYMSLLE